MKVITPFMMELHKQLKEKRNIADSTASQYLRTLYSLNSELPFKNLAWLKNTASVEIKLENYAESTQKSMISVIVSVLSLYKEGSYKKIYLYWYNRMMGNREEIDSSKKTDKQAQNWLNWDIIKAHEKRLEEEALASKGGPSGWNTILSYMVLSLYTKFSPRRNQDYQYMLVVKNPKQAKSTNENYYVIDTNEFIFNKYKTSKTYGEQKFEVPDDLAQVIKLYLKAHPNTKKGAYQFLVNFDGSPLQSINAITRILNKIFGKKIGVSMLRHIFLSNMLNIDEMKQTADEMGHSLNMQREYVKSE
jgi:hypothetical protein